MSILVYLPQSKEGYGSTNLLKSSRIASLSPLPDLSLAPRERVSSIVAKCEADVVERKVDPVLRQRHAEEAAELERDFVRYTRRLAERRAHVPIL